MIKKFLALFMLLTVNAWGATYYIDPSVEDGGVGSEADPFNSFADLSLSTSDDVYVKAGSAIPDNSFTLAVSGTAEDHVTIGKYGTGANPVWTIPDGQNQAIYAASKTYFDINDIDFAGGTADQRMIYLATCQNFTVNRCTFSGTTALRGIYVYNNSASFDSYNWEINDCTFSGMITSGTPIYVYPDSATHTIYDFKVHGCTFTNTGYGVRIYYTEATVADNGTDPYGYTIEECTFTNLRWPAIWTCGSRLVSGHPSYWQNNTLTTIGASDAGNVNAIQASNCKGLTIRWNTINGVDTSVPDGHGIILDYAYTDDEHICDGVVVYGNQITGCTASDYSAGICNYKATNSVIYNNYSYGNGVGMSQVGTTPTGAVFYNNTCVGNILYGLDVKSGAVEATVRNNIFSGGSIGLAVRESSTAPTESHNCYYNNADYTFRNTTTNTTLDTTSAVTANPLLTGYTIPDNSPCKDTGTDLSTIFTTDITGKVRVGAYDIGAFEYLPGSTCSGTFGVN